MKKVNYQEYQELEFKRSRKLAILNMNNLKALMDLALDTKDKAWMKDIYVKMKRLSDIITHR